ncbi:MAG: hypothetical protein NTU98_14315 [Bacteroidetes bacterium]|nr:hypothetical protein [Bacteroidota bacterium]
MKKLFAIQVIILFVLMTFNLHAQKIEVVKGDLSILKSEKLLNAEFTYDQMAIGQLPNEAEYTAKKVKEHNDKEPGKGNQWLTEWNDNKPIKFEPAFITSFNKYTKKYGVVIGKKETSAKYTVKVSTIFLEIGFTGWSYANKPSEINLLFTFYEGNNPEKEIAVVRINGVKSTAGDYSYTSGVRIASAYTEAGKAFGKYMAKTVYSKK